jgi:hypothetical protein
MMQRTCTIDDLKIINLTTRFQQTAPMPRIDTSSDMYQNRDRSLTTFKKDLDQSVVYRDVVRPDDKARVKEVQQDVAALKNQDINRDYQQREMRKAEKSPPREPTPEPPRFTPLYEPRMAPPDRPIDRHSFITGGTVDVRA